MEELRTAVENFSEEVAKFTGSMTEAREAMEGSVAIGGGGGGRRGGVVRHPGSGWEDDSDYTRARRGGGSEFVPHSFWRNEITGSHESATNEIMQRGFEMPRFGNWTSQDYLSHLGYVGQRIGFRQGVDTETGRRDFMVNNAAFPGGNRDMAVEEFTDYHVGRMSSLDMTDDELDDYINRGWMDKDTGAVNRNAVREAAMTGAQRPGAFAGAMRGIGGGAMGAARVVPIAATSITALQQIPRFLSGASGPTRQGMGMGLERGDGFLGDYFNEASKEWAFSMADAFRESLPLIGRNGFLSMEEGQQINAAIHRAGYSRGDRERMFGAVADLRAERGLNIDMSVEQIDAATRHAGSSLQEFVETLNQVPAAAQASRTSVEEYQQQLHAGALALQQSGLVYSQASGMINAVSTGTGYQPDQAANLLNNRMFTIMGANRAGMTTGDFLADNEQRTRAAIMGPQEMFRLVTGTELNAENFRANRGTIENIYQFMNGQELFGLTKEQLMAQAIGGEDLARTGSAAAGLEDLSQQLVNTAGGFETLDFGNLDEGSNRSNFDARVRTLVEGALTPEQRSHNKFYDKFMKDLGAGDFNKDPEEELRRALQVIGEESRARNIQEQQTVGIAFQGFAEDVLRQVMADNGNIASKADRADRSGSSNFDRAKSIASSAYDVAHMLPGLNALPG